MLRRYWIPILALCGVLLWIAFREGAGGSECPLGEERGPTAADDPVLRARDADEAHPDGVGA